MFINYVKELKTSLLFNFKIFYKKENNNIKTNVLNKRINYFKDIKVSFRFILIQKSNKIISFNNLIFIITLIISN